MSPRGSKWPRAPALIYSPAGGCRRGWACAEEGWRSHVGELSLGPHPLPPIPLSHLVAEPLPQRPCDCSNTAEVLEGKGVLSTCPAVGRKGSDTPLPQAPSPTHGSRRWGSSHPPPGCGSAPLLAHIWVGSGGRWSCCRLWESRVAVSPPPPHRTRADQRSAASFSHHTGPAPGNPQPRRPPPPSLLTLRPVGQRAHHTASPDSRSCWLEAWSRSQSQPRYTAGAAPGPRTAWGCTALTWSPRGTRSPGSC